MNAVADLGTYSWACSAFGAIPVDLPGVQVVDDEAGRAIRGLFGSAPCTSGTTATARRTTSTSSGAPPPDPTTTKATIR
jgi:hypothetical protein